MEDEKFKINKKKIIKWIIIFVCLIIVAIYMDNIFVKNNKKPLFCLETKVFSDGKSKEFIGLGYKVHKYATSEDIYVYEMVSLFTKFDETKMLELSGGEIKEHEIQGIGKIVVSTKREKNPSKYPLGEVLTSTAELAGFVTPANEDDIEDYTKSFFKKNVLIACLLEEYSENVNYEIVEIIKQDAAINVTLRKIDDFNSNNTYHNYFLIETSNEKFTEQGYNVTFTFVK